MASKDLDRQIRERIDLFVGELNELVRQAALDKVSEALGAPARRGPGRPRGSSSTAKKASSPARKSSGKRIRRTAADIEKVQNKILTFLGRKPDSRMEDISKALSMNSKDVRRPLQMLLEDKEVKSKGNKRATAYRVA